MSRVSPFVIYHPEGFPMAFPEDTTFEEVVEAAEGYGDGTRIVRDERPGLSVEIGVVYEGKFVEGD